MENNNQSKEEAGEKNHLKDKPEQRGKKAIEANKKFNETGKDEQQINKEEQADAEQWRNEG